METVVAFNAELSGLYESKPPISKAKMTSITRSAMKAIKFYKHVVQSVEKFILKCKQEYKIPGLYVIDSIVRQSRHQFGTEKDVFAPRFARNMQSTFANLFQCSPDDKSKIIRVLNLWQKNNVFAPEVIQPLFDLANPNHPIYQNQGTTQDANSNGLLNSITQESPAQNMIDEGHTMSSDMSGPISVMSNANQFDPSTIRQLQQLQQFLIRQTNSEPIASTSSNSVAVQDSVKFNKKLLDYDYGDDEEEDKGNSPRQSQQQSSIDNNNISQLLNDPNVLRQLQNLQKLKQQEEKQSKLAEMRLQEEAFEKQLATMLKKLPFANECDLSRQESQIYGMQNPNLNAIIQQQQSAMGLLASNANADLDPEVELVSDDGKVEVINLDGNSRSPSMDRDRYSKRRRSRSRSRDRLGRRRRSRSPRTRRRANSRDRDRGKDKEKERDRKRRGLPDIKRDHLSVCSTTLWIGHLSKLVQQEELSDTFAKYGDIVSIDMIHPRGCAYIVMHRRQDAFKAIAGLKSYKLHGRAITISWAAGKGVKSKEWKDYWDLDLGVSYIPWSKINENTDFEQLEDGGMFDEDTTPAWLTEKLKNQSQKKDVNPATATVGQIPNMPMFNMDTTQPPPQQMMPQMVPPFPMGAVPRFMPPMNMNMGLPLGVPPPMNGQMMIPQPGMVPGMPPPMGLDKPPPSAAGGFMSYFPPMAQIPPMPQTSTIPSAAGSADDHMDIEMEDETASTSKLSQNNNQSLISPMNMFNRPPPQLFGQNTHSGLPSLTDDFPSKDVGLNLDANQDDRSNSRDRNSASHDREREFRGRGRERERDNRNRGGNRDNRRADYSNERNTRWPENRGRSRDDDTTDVVRTNRQNSRERNDRRSRDRNERDKPLQDRLRDLAGDGNNRIGDFNNPRNNQQWRDGPPHPINFGGNNFVDRRALNLTGAPPALEDIRIPIPLESLRGPPIGPMGNKNHHNRGFDFNRGGDEFDRRQLPPGQQGREFYAPNRFGPPNLNGSAMGIIRGQQFGPRNNSPMFMWGGPRAGLSNNDRQFFDRDGNSEGPNRNERMRGNSDARNRNSRPNWKDNDDTPHKNRNNRSFDNQKDNRKSSRWGNHSPKSIVSDDNWDSEPSSSAKKSTSTRSKAATGNEETVTMPTEMSSTDTNELQTEPIDDNSQSDDFVNTNESRTRSHTAKSPSKQQQSQETNDTTFNKQNKNESIHESTNNKNNVEPTEASSVESNRKTNNNNNNNNQSSSADVNTTPLYDEPSEERSYSAKEKSAQQAAYTSTTISQPQQQKPPSSSSSLTSTLSQETDTVSKQHQPSNADDISNVANQTNETVEENNE